MANAGDIQTISRMLASPRKETAIIVEQERVICSSVELRQTLVRVDKTLQSSFEGGHPSRIALFSDDQDECSMIAAAIVERARGLGFAATLTQREWGRWARAAKGTGNTARSVHVLPRVPPEQKANEGFAAIAGDMILLWPLAMAGTALLPAGIEEIILTPFAERPLDKAAHLIAAVADELETMSNVEEESRLDSSAPLRGIDAGALLAVCVDPSKLTDIGAAREAGRRLAETVRTHAALRPDESLSAGELHGALFPQELRLPPNLRRLWVEGDTDALLLRLADHLMQKEYPSEYKILDSITIEALGGAARVDSALQRCNRDSKLELFLFDCDTDGSRGATKTKERGFPTLLLERDAVMAACDVEWVIEDLISVSCLDRFYSAHPDRRPAREEISYHPICGRRLVVRGEDKGMLADWLQQNAVAEDVFGIIHQLLSIRRRFALREPAIRHKPPGDGRSGLRPQPWWYVQG